MLRCPFFFYASSVVSIFVHTQSFDGGPQRRERNMGVYLCCGDGLMPEAHLDQPDVFPEL